MGIDTENAKSIAINGADVTESNTIVFGEYNCIKNEMMYHGLFDEANNNNSWEKSTVEYAQSNRNKVIGHIKKEISEFSYSPDVDAIEVYSSLMMKLYRAEDYDPTVEGNIKAGVDRYVYSILSFIIKDFRSKECDRNRLIRPDTPVGSDDDGEDVMFMDLLGAEDNKLEEALYKNTDMVVKELNSRRYEYGFDIIQVIYTYMKVADLGLDIAVCWDIVNMINGADMKDIKVAYDRVSNDDAVMAVIKSIEIEGSTRSIRKWVYGAGQIDRAVNYAVLYTDRTSDVRTGCRIRSSKKGNKNGEKVIDSYMPKNEVVDTVNDGVEYRTRRGRTSCIVRA